MPQRIVNITAWLWCLIALQTGPVWSPVGSVSAKSPPKAPTTVEAQSKFFQDFFSVQLSPYKIEFGHVCEDPNNWEQRYEKKDFKNHRDMGKVRWGDKKGGYGEHYWDLNHAGHNNDHDNDDGSYNPHGSDDGSYNYHDPSDAYDEPSEQSPSYGNDETSDYDPKKASLSPYDDSGRSKRAHPRLKSDRKPVKEDQEDDIAETSRPPHYKQTKSISKDLIKRPSQIVEKSTVVDIEEENEEPRRVLHEQKKVQKTIERDSDDSDDFATEPAVNKLAKEDEQQPYYAPRRIPESSTFVPYEHGAGVRQHYPTQQAAASAPARLFLEPSTGHVVDRATGQAYILQPIIGNNNN